MMIDINWYVCDLDIHIFCQCNCDLLIIISKTILIIDDNFFNVNFQINFMATSFYVDQEKYSYYKLS